MGVGSRIVARDIPQAVPWIRASLEQGGPLSRALVHQVNFANGSPRVYVPESAAPQQFLILDDVLFHPDGPFLSRMHGAPSTRRYLIFGARTPRP